MLVVTSGIAFGITSWSCSAETGCTPAAGRRAADERAAVNSVCQGSGADKLKVAVVLLQRRIRAQLPPSSCRLVHMVRVHCAAAASAVDDVTAAACKPNYHEQLEESMLCRCWRSLMSSAC